MFTIVIVHISQFAWVICMSNCGLTDKNLAAWILGDHKTNAPSQYKDVFPKYGDSLVQDKTVLRLSYL